MTLAPIQPKLNIGDFTVFGFINDSDSFLKHRLPSHLGINPRTINFGDAGQMFFYTTYGDIAETDEAIAIKLGFIRSLTHCPLSAQQLLAEKVVDPKSIDSGRIRGNALVACLGKNECSISAYKTLLGVPQLYYAHIDSGIICSDRLLCIVRLLDKPELDEDLIPMHFLFRSTPGDLTYYRHIRRLLPGGFLYWKDGQLSLRLIQDFQFTNYPEITYRGEENITDSLYANLHSVVGDYVTQVEQKGESLATMLSGGVDSSLLQYLINMETTHLPSDSYSYAVRAPSFLNEIEYAQQASQLFHTNHTFVDIQPEDYPSLLLRTIKTLAQPPILETEPSMLSLAEYASQSRLPSRYYVSGQGADAAFGLNLARKLKGLNLASKLPGSVRILKVAGSMLTPFNRLSQMVLKGRDILTCVDDPDTFLSPANSIAVYADLNTLRRCFGDSALINALRYRRDFAARYLDTEHYLERIHTIDLLTDSYEVAVQRQQLFLAHERQKIHPFLDEDVLRTSLAIPADSRYIKGLRPKYLLRDLLQRKTGAAVAHKPKGFSIWEDDLLSWMENGPLRPFVDEIELPGFLSRSDYKQMLKTPSYFLWELLLFDLFQRSLKSAFR